MGFYLRAGVASPVYLSVYSSPVPCVLPSGQRGFSFSAQLSQQRPAVGAGFSGSALVQVVLLGHVSPSVLHALAHGTLARALVSVGAVVGAAPGSASPQSVRVFLARDVSVISYRAGLPSASRGLFS